MKILFISKYAAIPESGNPSRQYFFAKELALLGHEMMLVNSRSNGINQQLIYQYSVDKKQKNIKGLEILTLWGPLISLGMNFKRIWSWLWFEVQLLRSTRRFRDFGADIVLVSSLSFFSFLNGIRLSKKFRIPLVIEIRDIYPLTLIEVGGMKRWNPMILFMERVERRVYLHADLVISSLENANNHVNKVVGGKKTFLWIPMGFDVDLYSKDIDQPSREVINHIKKIKASGGFVIGYAGTIGEANALTEIFRVMNDEAIKAEKIYFVSIGDGSLRKRFERQYGNTHCFFFNAIKKESLPYVLTHCDLLYNAWLDRDIYQYGVSPNKWIDYMYSGRPILLGLTTNSKIFDDAGCGWKISAENLDELKESLFRIRSLSKVERDKKGASGKSFLLTNLSYPDLAKKMDLRLRHIVEYKN